MAIQLFGPRQKPKKRVVGYQPSGLDTGYNSAAAAGGGIQPGAHPEYSNIQPGLSNPISQIMGMFKKRPKNGVRPL